MNLKTIFLILAILYTLALITLAIAPGQTISQAVEGDSRALHFLQFFVFGMILLTTLHLYNVNWLYSKGILIGVFLAAASEALQIIVPSRAFSLEDIIANFLGLTLAIIVFFVFRMKKLE